MTKKKRGHPEIEEILARPWCYYCERDFDDLKILINHQKAKHFKCERCGRRLNTAGGLSVHMSQVHKETLSAVDNALPNRAGLDLEIFGMEGVPEDIINQHTQRVLTNYHQAEAERRAATGNPAPGAPTGNQAKKPKFESPSDLKKRLAEHKAKLAEQANGGGSGSATPQSAEAGSVQGQGRLLAPQPLDSFQSGSPAYTQAQQPYSAPALPTNLPYGQPPPSTTPYGQNHQQNLPLGQSPSTNAPYNQVQPVNLPYGQPPPNNSHYVPTAVNPVYNQIPPYGHQPGQPPPFQQQPPIGYPPQPSFSPPPYQNQSPYPNHSPYPVQSPYQNHGFSQPAIQNGQMPYQSPPGGPPRPFGTGSPVQTFQAQHPMQMHSHTPPQSGNLPQRNGSASLPAAPGLPQRPSFGAPSVNAFQFQQMHQGQAPPAQNLPPHQPPRQEPSPFNGQSQLPTAIPTAPPNDSVATSLDDLISSASKQAEAKQAEAPTPSNTNLPQNAAKTEPDAEITKDDVGEDKNAKKEKTKSKAIRMVYSDDIISPEEKMAKMARYAFTPERKTIMV